MNHTTTRAEFITGLTERRRQIGLTQKRLADLIGVSWRTLSNWERGESPPSRMNLAAWAEALDVEPFPDGAPPIRPECGTPRGYQTHKRQRRKGVDEVYCGPCTDANTTQMMIYRAARANGAAA